MELILSSSKREYHTDLSQKNIIKNRQSNDRATRLPSVWSWWLAWSTPTISHTSGVARSLIRFCYLCITNKVDVELWPDHKWQIRWLWNPACLKASWGRLWTGANFLRQLCENLQGVLPTFKIFCLYVEFRNSEAHQELVDKAQLIQEALTEKREE